MRVSKTKWVLLPGGFFALSMLAALGVPGALAQKTTAGPVVDSAADASPLRAAPASAPVVDAAADASPMSERKGGPGVLPAHAALAVQLAQGIDSGHLHNGQNVAGTLTAPVTLTGGKRLTAGTPVALTVVATVPAGEVNAVGEFSVDVERVGGVGVFTDVLTFRGKPGPKDVADAAPQLGTNAGLPAGAALTFHVQPPAQPETTTPQTKAVEPGAVVGTAPGSPAAPGTKYNVGAASSGTIPAAGTPASTTNPGAATNSAEPGLTPSQPGLPSQPSAASRTQPR